MQLNGRRPLTGGSHGHGECQEDIPQAPDADRLAMRLDLPPNRVSTRAEELANAFKALQAANATAKPRRCPRPNTGWFATEEEALHAVVDRLVTALKPEEIWLFGAGPAGTTAPKATSISWSSLVAGANMRPTTARGHMPR